MLSASALSTTFGRLFNGIANAEAVHTKAINDAYRKTARRYAKSDPALFDRAFIHQEANPIVDAFLAGKLPRHQAAGAMAKAWNVDHGPVSSRGHRMRLADTTMMADVFLTELGMALSARH